MWSADHGIEDVLLEEEECLDQLGEEVFAFSEARICEGDEHSHDIFTPFLSF